jgi:hypothetical protein
MASLDEQIKAREAIAREAYRSDNSTPGERARFEAETQGLRYEKQQREQADREAQQRIDEIRRRDEEEQRNRNDR